MQHLLQYAVRRLRTTQGKSGVLLALCLTAFGLGMVRSAAATAPPLLEWVARYNGPGNNTDEPSAIAVDRAGDVYVTGYSLGRDSIGSEFVTVKYSGASGQQLWVARYTTSNRPSGRATALALDTVGGVYVTGYLTGAAGDDYITIKYDGGTGQQLWISSYNGPGNGSDEASAIAVDGTGDVLVTGYSWGANGKPDFATLKYNGATGQQLWVARYDGPVHGYDQATALAVDGTGNVFVTGRSGTVRGDLSFDLVTLKLDGATGQQLWSTRSAAPASGSGSVEPTALRLDGRGDVFITSASYSQDSAADYATYKYDGTTGQQLWVARGDGTTATPRFGNALAVDQSGNVFVGGVSGTGDVVSDDFLTVKYDGGTGQQLWASRYDGPIHSTDVVASLALDDSGSVYVTGSSLDSATPNIATVKYDGATGEQSWVAIYDGPAHSLDGPVGITVDGSGNVYVTGSSIGNGSSRDFATLKYRQNLLPLTSLTVTDTTATLTWDTSQATTSVVEYGLTTAYGSSAAEETAGTSHVVTLTGLTAETTYRYRVTSRLIDGTTFELTRGSFTTAPGIYTISGKVTVGGAGYGGAQVIGGGHSVTTADDGTYTLTGVKSGAYQVQAFASGYTFASQVVQVGPSKSGVDFNAPGVPPPTGPYTISGTVTVEGAGLGGAQVFGGTQTATTAADGTYTLTNVPAGNYLVQAFAAGYVFPDRVVQVGPSKSGIDFAALYLITGKVTVAGAGLAGARVSAGSKSATTGADGSYTLSGLTAGSYLVQASATGLTFSPQTVVVGPSKDHVDFDVTATISGKVTIAGAGFKGAQVSSGGKTVFTGFDGSYTLTGLSAGSYVVHASVADYTFADQTVVVGPSKAGVNFDAPAVIRGTVTVGGVGLGGAQVFGAGQAVTTAPDGSYTLTVTKAGSYLVQAYFIGYTFPSQVVQVILNRTGVDFAAPFDPALNGSYTINGRVTVAGAGLAGALVIGAGQSVITADDGAYTLTDVGTGNYLVQAFAAGYTFPDQVVQVGPSKSGINFDAPATISGHVTVGGVGFAGAMVSGAGQTVYTAADGSYTLTNVVQGNYRVQAFAIGYSFPDQIVRVGPSQRGVDFNAPYDPALVGPFTISGKVTVGGAGVAGMLVSGAGQTVVTGADGSYALTNVVVGNYEVIAWGPGYLFPPQIVLVGPSKSGVDFALP